MLLQFTTARIITNHDNGLLQFTIGTFTYYKSRLLLLQFTTGITVHDNFYYNSWQVLQFTTLLQFTTVHTLHSPTAMECLFFSLKPLLEGGVKGVRKPQNRTEKLTKTAILYRILAKYRNRSYKCGVVLSSILEVRYSITNVILCIPITVYVVTKSFLLIWRDASRSSPPCSWI